MIPLELPSGWSFDDHEPPSARSRRGSLSGPDGQGVDVVLERCATGRLAPTYPTGAHDVEVRPDAVEDRLTEAVSILAGAVFAADTGCHRVVYAAPAGDRVVIAAAEAGDFRYVVDVDLPDAELSLLVAEPPSVTGQPAEVEQMPTSVQPQALT